MQLADVMIYFLVLLVLLLLAYAWLISAKIDRQDRYLAHMEQRIIQLQTRELGKIIESGTDKVDAAIIFPVHPPIRETDEELHQMFRR